MIKRKIIIVLFLLIVLTLSGCNKKSIEDAYPKNDVYYQIFVRSFADSDDNGVGDFNGIISKLDYLKDLGIGGLWLMPINPATSYHGYDVEDYYNVNSEYGTMDDFKNLCKEAKKRDIKVILDLVINHSSYNHEWFQKALKDDEKYADYYVFTTSPTKNVVGSWGQNIWHTLNNKKYCGYFSNTMPDLNYFNPAVKEEVFNIGKFWLESGASGFRIDAAQHIFGDGEYLGVNFDFYTNVIFLKEFENEMKKYNKDVYITGEINLTMEKIVKEYFNGIDSPLDFPISKKVVDSAKSNGDTYYVRNIIKIYDAYRKINKDFISAPFLRNHDEDRLANEYSNDINKLKLVSEMLLTLPGSPILYYGEEIGMFGSKSNGETSNGAAIYDETRRLPLNFGDEYTTNWFNDSNFSDVLKNKNVKSVNEQLLDNDSLLNTYKRIINVRNENIALKYGNSVEAYPNNTNQLQGFYREFSYLKKYQKVLVLHNLSINDIDMPEVAGKVLYLSGVVDCNNLKLTEIKQLKAKSTIIIDVTGN